jgi:hypothetical protein
MNGAALTTLGLLNGYGLIDRTRGEGLSVSPLAIRLFHPTSPDQELMAKREAALRPRIFNELLTGGFHSCAEEVLTSHLIQSGFTPDGARKAASIYKTNAEFAQITESTLLPPSISSSPGQDPPMETYPPLAAPSPVPTPQAQQAPGEAAVGPATTKILARYSIPLGANEATLVFTGQTLSPDDFDALAEYVALFKKQHERKSRSMELSKTCDQLLAKPPEE